MMHVATMNQLDDIFATMMGAHNPQMYGYVQRRPVRDIRRRQGVRDVKIEETQRGYLITAIVPGVKSNDVEASVEMDERNTASLRVKVKGESYDLALPSKFMDTAVAPKASCIDGVLRVAVLKKQSTVFEVPVRAESLPSEDGMDVDEEDENAITLRVPGFNARDISVSLHKPDDVLTISGKSKSGFGEFTKSFKNLPAALEPKHISATCADGVLKVSMADPDEIAPMDVVVSNLALSEDELKNKIVLIQRQVPGTNAAQMKVVLGTDRVLRIEAANAHQRATISTSVPRNVDHQTLQAICVDGIFTVLAERAANKSHSVHIEVSGDVIAALAEPAAAATTESLPSTEAAAAVKVSADEVTIEDVPM